jgi:hypothetical protein
MPRFTTTQLRSRPGSALAGPRVTPVDQSLGPIDAPAVVGSFLKRAFTVTLNAPTVTSKIRRFEDTKTGASRCRSGGSPASGRRPEGTSRSGTQAPPDLEALVFPISMCPQPPYGRSRQPAGVRINPRFGLRFFASSHLRVSRQPVQLTAFLHFAQLPPLPLIR